MHQPTISFWRNLVLAFALVFLVAGLALTGAGQAQTPSPEKPKVDHSQFAALQGPFASPIDVTKACLSCHIEAGNQIIHTTHWTWEFVNEVTGQTVGKKTLINNFCIGIQSNEPRCTSCHIGYGWKDNTFDFAAQENIDCLVCHDTTKEYKKFPTAAGFPVTEATEFPAGSGKIFQPPDLPRIAKNVGLTSRETCGVCHFYGGGGDEVKHGDLDSSLVAPSFDLDVHMSPEGQDYTCTDCHTTDQHQITGSRYSNDPEKWKGCETCHTDSPHTLEILNTHSKKVACQTCHIPEYARGGLATKMAWDWSKAGNLDENGKPIVIKDEAGHVIYDGQKGEFILEADVKPQYVWFNGTVEYTLAGQVIDPSGVVSINHFLGDREDPNARIFPLKRFTAVQPYDTVNNTLVIPHLFGKDEWAYWGNYDWTKAITKGMEVAGLPFSGEYGFVSTQMDWPITHMVAPAQQALDCENCHTPEGGRLDFAALGYNETEVDRLIHFPPTLTIETLDVPKYSPDSCSGCHQPEHGAWASSIHSKQGVGCVSCHQLQGEGEHPLVAYTMDRTATVCGACHLQEYRDWEQSKHADAKLSCATCHNPHSQLQKTVNNNQTTCETCHKQQVDDAQHSTHKAQNVGCLECHKNTELNSGHIFNVSSDSCLKCHGQSIHSANKLLQPSLMVTPSAEPAGALPADQAALEEAPAKGADIRAPWWVALFGVLVLGVGGFVLFGNHSSLNDKSKPGSK